MSRPDTYYIDCLQKDIDQLTAERDEARTEVTRLNGYLHQVRCDAMAELSAARDTAAELTAERNAALAEIERLRGLIDDVYKHYRPVSRLLDLIDANISKGQDE